MNRIGTTLEVRELINPILSKYGVDVRKTYTDKIKSEYGNRRVTYMLMNNLSMKNLSMIVTAVEDQFRLNGYSNVVNVTRTRCGQYIRINADLLS